MTEEESDLRERDHTLGYPLGKMKLPRSSGPGVPQDRIQTILNRVEEFESFVYGVARLEDLQDGPVLVVQMRPRYYCRPCYSGCGRIGPTYDPLEERQFTEF